MGGRNPYAQRGRNLTRGRNPFVGRQIDLLLDHTRQSVPQRVARDRISFGRGVLSQPQLAVYLTEAEFVADRPTVIFVKDRATCRMAYRLAREFLSGRAYRAAGTVQP